MIHGHSYLNFPVTRSNQRFTRTGCKGPVCTGPCDAPLAKAGQIAPAVKINRGDTIDLKWPRNNHAGGFIRVAWAPTAQSDSHDAFNKNVQFWTCHEMTCRSNIFPEDPLGDDKDNDTSEKCTASVKVPPQFADGKYTLQWTWYLDFLNQNRCKNQMIDVSHLFYNNYYVGLEVHMQWLTTIRAWTMKSPEACRFQMRR